MSKPDRKTILAIFPHADDEISIPNNEGSIGGTSATDIEQVIFGFDWDAGRVFIYPENMMQEIPSMPKVGQEIVYMDLNAQVQTGIVYKIINSRSLFLDEKIYVIKEDDGDPTALWLQEKLKM